ncbi:tannase/feruloyl esterase family alpha/beta hydrolase [uncultured Sphingomonas sp.]|uniref:tannase/feruloyl esterase family alpha/beta hydrolase n=1 Tax=uncultured Sphingomonas sp. TaxID=158754 RepID=UPI0025F6E33D|nr:tannase/feruloyl esterase family alpha/beta hydrolase [uncultured Sphingomonas sp.]
MSCAESARLAIAAMAIAALLAGSVDAVARTCNALAGRTTAVTESDGICRVTGVLRPVAGSRIGYHLWLPPHAGWSGRMVMLGNGGYSSRLPLAAMTEQLARGAAVVATDTGHDGDDPDFARGRPQAIVDWGWRAVHLSAVVANRLATRYYGRVPRYRYFNGCSTGGHQALMEAQRFPGDFDGIVAGAPGAARVRLNAAFLWQYLANHSAGDDSRPILGQRELTLLQRGALAACRADNGATAGGLAGDGWLNDPVACRFDPGILACASGRTGPCLSPEQLAAARRMYRGAVDPRSGARVTNPWLPGSEAGWTAYLSDGGRQQPARTSFWRVWAFADPAWSWWRFDFGRDLDRIRRTLSPKIDAVDPNLARFRASGGKLLHYHGLADPVVSPFDSIQYHSAVAARMPTADWYRLFLAPGMGHCGGGPGFSRFDPQQAIEAWVERGRAPDRLLARPADPMVDTTRPLCPHPTRAVHIGGDPARADSFACHGMNDTNQNKDSREKTA